ncbi:ribosome maturation factor RimM [Halomonas sp. ANAO-440]|uniref:ribosome maturation factor RimM n=1 Tax=Halomonas sp. ANAO-440 TaxID=2861360 RepID=UPI001CAA5540|nr:ribosome maturation factor RimM [Halomonas sp. ANAO-440]MBZ0330247.1 ribosome maturation factor RimM [Halomonas sp. ANAO-440]
MSEQAERIELNDHVVLGKLTSPYGVKGWLKVYSHTSPMDGILEYPEWVLRQGTALTRHRLLQGRRHGKGLVALLEGVDGREAAEAMAGAEILLPKSALPGLPRGDYYWHQLEGLVVATREGEVLGRVSYLFETGANDVLVVKGDPEGEPPAIDDRERLLPYLPDEVIVEVDLAAGTMTVDWDPAF